MPELTLSRRGPGVFVDLDVLIKSRGLIQANSGGGKSWALRFLLEQTHHRVPQIVIDPEGEFSSLRQKFDYVLAAARDGDVLAAPGSARLLCRRLVELRTSAVLDIYDLPLGDRRKFVRLFLEELMSLPRSLWRPILVVVDEAHLFAPEKGAGEAESLEAMIALATQGRKRGFCMMAATQRLSKLHKDVAAELLNKMIGRTGLDVDLVRAGNELGFDKEKRGELRHLQPGTFFVYGPAIANEVLVATTGPVQTTHPEAGRLGAAPPPAPPAIAAMMEELRDLPQQAADEARTVAELQKENRALKAEIKRKPVAPAPPAPPPVKPPRTIEVKVVPDAQIKRLEQVVEKLEARASNVRAVLDEAVRGVEKVASDLTGAIRAARAPHAPAPIPRPAPAIATRPAPVPVPRPRRGPDKDDDFTITRPRQRILDVLSSLEALGITSPLRGVVAGFAGVSPNTGGFNNNLGAMRGAGLISYPLPEHVALTDEGRARATAVDAPLTLQGLHEAWLRKLSRPRAKILGVILENHPNALSRQQIAEAIGVAFDTGGFNNNLGAMRTLGIVDYPSSGMVGATALLFPEGLV